MKPIVRIILIVLAVAVIAALVLMAAAFVPLMLGAGR